MIDPKFKALAEEQQDHDFAVVDVDANSDTTQAAGIEAMPTFQIFWAGEKVDTIRGANEQALRESI